MLAATALTFLVTGCAAPQTENLMRNPPGVPERGSVSDAVFYAQRTKECGPAALAMALSQSGVSITPDDLVPEVYNPGREGSLATAVLAAARRHGRIAYPVGSLKSLLGELSAGRPVIVLQNLALTWSPQWHFAVAIGYDLAKKTITLHSGSTRSLEVSLSTFERTWQRAGFWGLVLLRPGELPERPDEKLFVRAVAGGERAGDARMAAASYGAALDRWPDNLVAAMGRGNALYRLGDRTGAARAFRVAAGRHPASADARNNLAHVLMELGRLEEAEKTAREAVALGGSNAKLYRATLEAIQARRASGS